MVDESDGATGLASGACAGGFVGGVVLFLWRAAIFGAMIVGVFVGALLGTLAVAPVIPRAVKGLYSAH